MADDREATTRAILASDGPYEIRHGDVWLRNETVHVVDGTGRLAVAFDGDGVLLKRGEATRVSEYARKAEAVMGAAGVSVTVVDFPVTPETVEELNACVAATGRVLGIVDRLRAMDPARPVVDASASKARPGRFGVVTDRSCFGRNWEDGEPVTGDVHHVLAEFEDGRRFVHARSFPTLRPCVDPEGRPSFANVEGAKDAAERLLARVQARGTIDLAHWVEDRPAYGSEAYVDGDAEADMVAWERDADGAPPGP